MTVDFGCFAVGMGSISPPSINHLNILCVPVSYKKGDKPMTPPVLNDFNKPISETDKVLISEVYIPFNSIMDKTHDTVWKYLNSPFYTISRYDYYSLACSLNNHLSTKMTSQQNIEYGVSTSSSESFKAETAISVTVAFGVNVGILESTSGASATVTKELGYSSSTSVSQMQLMKERISYTIPPKTNFAVYKTTTQISLNRGDSSVVSSPLLFSPPGVYSIQYPPNSQKATMVIMP